MKPKFAVPGFLFHVPHRDGWIDHNELERLSKRRHGPSTVLVKEILEPSIHKIRRHGEFDISTALIKFR